MKIIIFACVHNAGRSQMAAAWFNGLADRRRVRALSAGTSPAGQIHPEVLQVMLESGMDLSKEIPKLLSNDLAAMADLLITMGCGETCPMFPGLRKDDWALEDPKGKPLERVREIRDDIKERVVALLTREGWQG